MEELLRNVMPIIYIAVGALITYWSSSRSEKKKRKLSVKLELIHSIHLLFGYNALYLRHSTIARIHDVYSQTNQTELKNTQSELAKEEMYSYRNSMQTEIDASVKTYDTILKIEADIYKTTVEITELFSLAKSNEYRRLIAEILFYTKSADSHNIASDLTPLNYGALIEVVKSRLTLRAQEFSIKAEEYIKKIEAIK